MLEMQALKADEHLHPHLLSSDDPRDGIPVFLFSPMDPRHRRGEGLVQDHDAGHQLGQIQLRSEANACVGSGPLQAHVGPPTGPVQTTATERSAMK